MNHAEEALGEEREPPRKRKGTTSRMMKLNQPPKELVEEGLLEHGEELLRYHGVGCLGEERRKGGAQFFRGS